MARPTGAIHHHSPFQGKYSAENVIVAAGCWLPSVVPNLPLKAVGHIIGVYFWRIKSRPELFRPLGNGGSPNLVISDELGQELFGLPGTDYPDTMKFAIHLGMPVEDLDKMVKEKILPEWMESIPRAHLATHFPDLDSSMPLVKSTCVYTVRKWGQRKRGKGRSHPPLLLPHLFSL